MAPASRALASSEEKGHSPQLTSVNLFSCLLRQGLRFLPDFVGLAEMRSLRIWSAVCAMVFGWGWLSLMPLAAAEAEAEPGWFAFDPKPDDFRSQCPIDLRFLNERFAGEHG